MLKTIKYNTVNIDDNPTKAFVMIHGWRGNKDSFKSIPPLLKLSKVRWYFPEAPYDFEGNQNEKTWAIKKEGDVWNADESKRLLVDFFENIVFKKFDPKDVYIMGFSQGAAVCYEFILSLNYNFGGIFPIAGFMVNEPKNIDQINAIYKNIPILIGHGNSDDIVPLAASQKAYDFLSGFCLNVELYIYNGKHKIGLEYLKKVKKIVESWK